jgi:GT2 family glycosyltransferase
VTTAETDWPRVSVVVLNMDGKRHLGPCFQSLMEMDYPADQLEVILVDNGSRDRSVRYVQQEFPQVRIIQNERNEGFAGPNNQGAAAATGEYVAFLNNDMRVHPHWLRELVAAMRSAPDVAIVGGKILTWDGDAVDFGIGSINFYGMGFQPPDASPSPDQHAEVLFACGGSMLVRRQIFLEVGGFDPDYFAYFEDVDLGWRLWLLGYRVLYAPRSLTYHRGHGTSSRMTTAQVGVLYERNALYSIIKNYDEDHLQRVLPAALLLLVRRALIFGRVDKRTFRMPRSDSSGPPPFQAGQSWMKDFAPQHDDPLYRRWLSFAEEYGVWSAIKASIHVVLLWGYRLVGQLLRSQTLLMQRHAVSHLVAADDVVDSMPSLMDKRALVQAQRKRSDAEILPLFRTPFHPHPPYEEYAAVQSMLSRIYGIDEMFAGSAQSS